MSSPLIILFCTVGGSYQPIVTAIQETAPDFVVFFCTENDPGTGRPGSISQVTGSGNCIKTDFKPETKPTLPNIPTQVGLSAEQFLTVMVPADDLSECYRVIQASLREFSSEYPEARQVADYTGGTKTMTAALAMAAINMPAVFLRLVAGSRANLRQVTDGSQYQKEVELDALRFEPLFEKALASWRQYAWQPCASSLDAIKPSQPELINRWQRARMISKGFACWDRFDYGAAKEHLENYNAVISKTSPEYFSFLRCLTTTTDKHNTTARLWDLWLNALRCGENGRYDDAVSRIYRLLEWAAQWQLEHYKDLKTGELTEKIAKKYDVFLGHSGKYQTGLHQSWEILAGELPNSHLALFYGQEKIRMKDHIQKRNNSLLAHGTTPVSKSDWEAFKGWMEKTFIPSLAKAFNEKPFKQELYPQLPNRYIWDQL